jgi:hypothetical protein
MGAKRVINGVHVVPMGLANAFLIEGDDGLTLIDAGFPAKEAAVFGAIDGIGRSADQLRHLVFTHGHPDHIGSAAAIVRKTGCEDLHAPARYPNSREWRPLSAYEAGTWSVGASAVQAVLRPRRANGTRCYPSQAESKLFIPLGIAPGTSHWCGIGDACCSRAMCARTSWVSAIPSASRVWSRGVRASTNLPVFHSMPSGSATASPSPAMRRRSSAISGARNWLPDMGVPEQRI